MSEINPEIEEELRKFIKKSSKDDLLNSIRFSDTINAWDGYLETHLSDGFVSIEIPLNTIELKNCGIEIKDSSPQLREAALEQLKELLGLNVDESEK